VVSSVGAFIYRPVVPVSINETSLFDMSAVASGISVKKMMFSAMLISGAVAGLVGMPELLNGLSGSYSLNFQTGIGFTGIAIALLGRNHPVGIVFASALWSFLASSSNALQSVNVPKELVTIMQGIIVLLVVIAYEIVRRAGIVLEQRDVARQLAATAAREEVAA
jgi:simple sugar transport system permease protein